MGSSVASVIPHLRVPLQVVAGHLAVVEQDSEDELAQSVAVVLGTLRGERPVVPGFGITDQGFQEPRAAELVAAVEANEPRVRVLRVDGPPGVETVTFVDPMDETNREVHVGVGGPVER